MHAMNTNIAIKIYTVEVECVSDLKEKIGFNNFMGFSSILGL